MRRASIQRTPERVSIRNPILVTILLALPLLATAGEVQVFPVKGVDLARFKTFKMLPTRVLTGSGVLENDPEVSPFINSALRNELTQKGLKEVAEGADLEVSAGALVVSIPQVEAIIYNFANLPGDTSWGTSPITTIGRYNREGTLIVNLIDPAAKKSVWLGFAKRALGKPSNRKRDIDKAARDLFKKYPAPK
jgi:hypothetical protein